MARNTGSTADRKTATRKRVNAATTKARTKADDKTTTKTKGTTKATAKKAQPSKPQTVEATIEARAITPVEVTFGKFDRNGKYDENYTGPAATGGVCFSAVKEDNNRKLDDSVLRQVYISQEEVAENGQNEDGTVRECTLLLVWH